MDKISIVIPTWERVNSTIDAFIDVHDDPRISLIHIVDDCSSDEVYEGLKWWCEYYKKIRLYRNEKNMQCYHNKAEAVSKSDTPYCILLDSDNKIDTHYIDKIYSEQWAEDLILTPDFAAPHFSFKDYSGMVVTKENVAANIKKPMFEVFLNAANFFVNAKKYLEVFEPNINPVTSDSIFMTSRWLERGYKIKVVEGLIYQHAVHSGSHYQNNVHLTPPGFHQNILQQLADMK